MNYTGDAIGAASVHSFNLVAALSQRGPAGAYAGLSLIITLACSPERGPAPARSAEPAPVVEPVSTTDRPSAAAPVLERAREDEEEEEVDGLEAYLGPDELPRYELSAVLARDSPMVLVADGSGEAVFIDGIPRALLRDGSVNPQPRVRGAGPLPQDPQRFVPQAYAEHGDEIYASSRWIDPSGASETAVMLRLGEAPQWEAIALKRPALHIVELYTQLLSWRGVLLGVPRYSPDSVGLSEQAAGAAALEAARRSDEAPQLVAVIDDDPRSRLPLLPEPWRPSRYVRTGDALYALAERAGDEAKKLWVWTEGREEPVAVTLPDAPADPAALDVTLSVSDDHVLVHGRPRYLAVGQGRSFTRVPVERPRERPPLDDEEHWSDYTYDRAWEGARVRHAARADEGALWITLSSDGVGRRDALLRQRRDGVWAPVRLPPSFEETLQGDGVMRTCDGWVPYWLEPNAYEEPRISGVIWSAERVWIAASFGTLEDSYGRLLITRRHALFSPGPVAVTPPIEPARHASWFAQARCEGAGADECGLPTIILGDASRRLSEAERGVIAALDESREVLPIKPRLYLAEDEQGQRSLALQLDRSHDPAYFERAMSTLRETFGAELRADCIPRRWLRSAE